MLVRLERLDALPFGARIEKVRLGAGRESPPARPHPAPSPPSRARAVDATRSAAHPAAPRTARRIRSGASS